MEDIRLAIAWYVLFVLSTSFHEAAHALAAFKLGDWTAYHGGQLTLDPVMHIRREPVGMVLVPLVCLALGGWVLGWASVPYDRDWARRYPKRSAMMSLAGPAANLSLVVAAAVLIRVGMSVGWFYAPEKVGAITVTATEMSGAPTVLAIVLSIVFTLNLVLFVFNLIPLPPLDGSGVLGLFLSEDAARAHEEFFSNRAVALVGLVVAWRLFDFVLNPVHILALNMLYPGSGYH